MDNCQGSWSSPKHLLSVTTFAKGTSAKWFIPQIFVWMAAKHAVLAMATLVAHWLSILLKAQLLLVSLPLEILTIAKLDGRLHTHVSHLIWAGFQWTLEFPLGTKERKGKEKNGVIQWSRFRFLYLRQNKFFIRVYLNKILMHNLRILIFNS